MEIIPNKQHPVSIDQFVTLLDKVRKTGNGYRAVCPAHQGTNVNLAIWTRDDGSIGVRCYSHGCDRKEVVEATGYTLQDYYPHVHLKKQKPRES